MPGDDSYNIVPTWSGDPADFESFVQSCKWYERSLKSSERCQAAARVWSRLQGAAKSVVRHLDPEEFTGDDGLLKLLSILQASPLQQLPIPDSFSRLERWHQLRRRESESIAELLIREEDLWVQMQSALFRARAERGPKVPEVPRVASGISPTADGGASPMVGIPTGLTGGRRNWHAGNAGTTGQTTLPTVSTPPAARPTVGDFSGALDTSDFWSNELRGYRLLKAAHLTRQEKQNILTQTNNATDFNLVRRALRTLFAEDEALGRQAQHGKRFARSALWNEADGWYEDGWNDDDWGDEDASWWDEPNATYWNEDSTEWTWDDTEYDSEWQNDAEMEPDENAEDPDEIQYREAYALATEANRTLKEARDAVRKVRSARGYFSPEANSGKGMSATSASRMTGKATGGKPSGKGKGITGACFRCGMRGHLSADCPDRFSPGKGAGKGSFKGKFNKGKGKGKSKFKGKNFYADVCTLTLMWNEDAKARNSFTRIVVDTGASESAVGADSLSKLLYYGNFHYDVCMDDRPVFRFGNGLKMQAMSRVDIKGTALGEVSFYVLGGTASDTPPLLGSKVLFQQRAHISYANSMMIFEAGPRESEEFGMFAVPIEILPTWHMTLDLRESAMMMDSPNYMVQSLPTFAAKDDVSANHVGDGEVFLPLFVMSTECQSKPPLCDRLQLLAQRLQDLRDRRQPNDGTMCRRRPTGDRIPMLVQSCAQAEEQPICSMGDMHEVRPSNSVCGEEGLCWREPADGTGATYNPRGDGVPGSRHEARGCEREDCQWPLDGSTGPNAPDGSDQYHGNQHVLCRLPETHGPREREAVIFNKDEPQADQGDARECHKGVDQPPGGDRSGTSLSRGSGAGEEGSGVTEVNIQSGSQDEIKGQSCGQAESGRSVKPGLGIGWCGGFGRGGRQGGPCDSGLNHVASLKQKLSELQAQMGGGGKEGYETAGEQYPNSKGLPIDLAGPSDEDGLAGDVAFERPVDESRDRCNMQFCDEHGNPTSCMTSSINMDKPPTNMTSEKNVVLPNVAKKIARNAAMLGCLLVAPVLGLFGQLQDRPDFMEIACSANSALSKGMEDAGYHIKRVNYLTGYDISTKQGTSLLKQDIALHPPRFGWVSLPCTRLSSLVNLTQRTDEQWASFLKRQRQDIKRASEVVDACEPVLQNGDDLAWEWPTSATPGWKSHAIKKLLYLMHKHNRTPYWCRFDGCAYGLTYNQIPVRKGWTVLTTNKHLWLSLQKRCPGHQEHCECRGPVAQASAYYPHGMVRSVVKAIQGSWQQVESEHNMSITKDVETYLLDINVAPETDAVVPHQDALRQECPGLFALTRNRYPSEPPTGKKLELIKQQMMRVHRAAGHVPFSRLQKMLAVRKAPAWAIELAGNLQCPSCTEAKRSKPASVASLKETPSLYEIVGMDIFELEVGDRKHKALMIRDRASGMVMVEYMKEYETNWEPTSDHIISAVCRWLMHNPKPQWVITDSATYLHLREDVGVLRHVRHRCFDNACRSP